MQFYTSIQTATANGLCGLQPSPEGIMNSSASPVSIQAKKILVADDDETIRFAVSKVLARAGFQVSAVCDGQQAWELLQHQHYDLLITDNEMPCLAGLELIQRIREADMSMLVIIASGSFPVERMRDYPELRIAAALPKPFGISELLDIVRFVLRPSCGDIAAEQTTLTAQQVHNRILIVDDDALVRGSLAAVLEYEGFSVDEAENGLEAVSHAIHKSPALILLDLNMPMMDGWAAFTKLDHVRPLVPVVVITARPNQYNEAVRVGVDAFMEKPLNIPILVSAIKRLSSEDENRYVRRITNPAFVTELLDIANS